MSIDRNGNDMGGIIYSPDVWKEVIKLSRDLTFSERAVIVDTNYLTLINKKDFVSMLLDPNYESTVRSSLKKQMAKLFRDFMERKIDLCFSNFIMREFIGLAPKRKDLLEIYRRYIVIIGPKENLEPYFLDLAAAINSCIVERGEEGDVKDTYSYILAALVKIKFFVTEDRDVKRVYRYLSRMKEKSSDEIRREIRKIKGVFGLLCETSNPEFPIDEILSFLFFEGQENLPVPVSIARLENRLPQVLERFELILWMFRSLQEIDWLRGHVGEMPAEWNDEIVATAKKRIYEVANSIGVQPHEAIDECSFKSKLIEEETRWSQQTEDQELASNLSHQLDLLHGKIYEEETEVEYLDWEEKFNAEEPIKKFMVMCSECNETFEIEADYNGVVNVEQREMGPEFCHEWSEETTCPNCGNDVSITHELYEYPQFFYNFEDTECNGCEILHEEAPEPPSTTLEDFM